MSERLYIFDTTLRDGEQVPGCQLNTTEKIEVAKLLESLGVDVIEAGFPISSPGDFNSVLEISKAVSEPTICALTRAVKKDIDVAADALRLARRKRIPYGHRRFAAAYLRQTAFHAREDRRICRRGGEICQTLRRGCGVLCRGRRARRRRVPRPRGRGGHPGRRDGGQYPRHDGLRSSERYGAKIKYLVDNVPNIDRAIISTHCHNDLGMATANTLSGILNGAGRPRSRSTASANGPATPRSKRW